MRPHSQQEPNELIMEPLEPHLIKLFYRKNEGQHGQKTPCLYTQLSIP